MWLHKGLSLLFPYFGSPFLVFVADLPSGSTPVVSGSVALSPHRSGSAPRFALNGPSLILPLWATGGWGAWSVWDYIIHPSLVLMEFRLTPEAKV